MKKVAVNRCYGVGLSKKAVKRIAELQGKQCHFFVMKYDSKERTLEPIDEKYKGMFWLACDSPDATIENYSMIEVPDDRSDPILIQVLEELRHEANGECSEIEIVEIPDDVDYIIEEYDGKEWVAEQHRTW